MNMPDLIPALEHCQAEVDSAAKNDDVDALKHIFKREGVPGYMRDENGNYKPDIES